jgi:F-type H+-transporting ATPase subunit epsilon/F-type H+-transporting ATPase subunit delta
MSDKFTVEIITPNKTILKTETNEVNIPSFEGQMGILKDHISLITFLRPGIISIQDQEKKYYVEEGTVEFSNNNLLILTSTARDLTNLNQESIEELLKSAENKSSNNHYSDKEKYISSYKISTLKEISQ